MDLSKRAANLHNVREVRGLVTADALSPTGVVGADWRPLLSLRADSTDPDFWYYRGEASIVEHPYMVRDMWGEFEETIAEGAFTKTLSEKPDVVLNYMHMNDTAMATTGGGGLTLKADPHLSVEARIPKTDADAQRVMPKVERGDAASMSFAFRVTRQEWNEDYTQRRITEVNLDRGDVAVIVTGLGANPAAWGTVRADMSAEQVMAWFGEMTPDQRSTFIASLDLAPTTPAPEIVEPDPDAVRAWLEQTARIQERARAERDRLAGIPTV